jgi:cytochrome c-type biogenesis protein CcmH/NrfG
VVQSVQNRDRRRVQRIFLAGLILLVIAGTLRLFGTDTLTRWKASRLSDDALATVAKGTNAPYPYVFEWARRLEAGGRLPEAQRVYVRAMELAPTNVEPWVGVGRTAFAVGDWGKSAAVLGKTVEQWPDNAQAHFAYAAVLASTFRVRKAIEQMQSGIKLNPAKGEAYVTLGELETREGNAAAAADAYAQARKLVPNTKRLQSFYGGALVNAGRYLEAQPVLEAALKEDPSDINARFDMGKALANDGKEADRSRAMQELNRVVEFSQNKSRAYLEAARVWLREGDRGNGIQALEHAYDLNPNNVDVLTLMVQAYNAEGRHMEAQKVQRTLDQAQAIADEHKGVLARLDADEDVVPNLIRLGRIDVKMGNFLEAQTAFVAAAALDPGNADAARELKSVAAKLHQK